MKVKTLCFTCKSGLVYECECECLDNCHKRHFGSKCTFGWGDTYASNVIMCNQYERKEKPKVTYYDPDFASYEDKVMEGAKEIKK